MKKVTGAKALMEIFHREGVEYIFGLPGATESVFMDALEDEPGIKYILGLNEIVIAGMAEGYNRASRKPGVLNVHTYTGLTAALPMLSNAYAGGVPLIVTAGQQDTRLNATEPFLWGDTVKIASPFTKWATEIIHAKDIPLVIRRAFKVANYAPTGPVFVSLPQNILAETLDFEYPRTAPENTRLRPDPESVQVAADVLIEARNPVILVGDGVTKSEALSDVVKFAETIGARVYSRWMSDVNFPVNHPLYLYDLDVSVLGTRALLKKVDVLITIGALLFAQDTYLAKPLLTPATKIIQIDDNPWEIAKNFPIISGIEGDIRESVNELTGAVEKKLTVRNKRVIKARITVISQDKNKSVRAFEEKVHQEKDNIPISGSRLMQEIKSAVKPGTRIIDDCWSYSAILRRTLDLKEPLSYMRSRGGGSIGWGLSGALGVKLASPDRPVICISGDGSAMWSIQTLWSASHHKLPVTYIILSNGCYRQVRFMRTVLFGEKARGRNLGTDLCDPKNDFSKLAEGMGLIAQKVEKPEQLKSALETAFNMNQANLVEVEVDPSL